MAVAAFISQTFHAVGTLPHVTGHIVGEDRRNGSSPFLNGDDATVAVSMVLKIGAELVGGSADLMNSGRHYAGAALVRQMVEVEYLAWAFDMEHADATRWLRSTTDERWQLFRPNKIRKRAGTRFQARDYHLHCGMGGHPAPDGRALLNGDAAVAQMILADCLGHAWRVWEHAIGWASKNTNGAPCLAEKAAMTARRSDWLRADGLAAMTISRLPHRPSPPSRGRMRPP